MLLRPKEYRLGPRYVEYVHSNLFFIASSFAITMQWVNRLGSFVLDRNAMEKASRALQSDIIQVEDVRAFRWVERHRARRSLLVLIEHNVEYLLRSGYSKSRQYLRRLRETEKHALDNADMVFVTSQNDLECLKRVYDVEDKKLLVVPNGVNCSGISIPTEEQKETIKRLLGFSSKKVILFAGSLHPPNIDACRFILKMSRKIKNRDTIFVIAGGVGCKFRKGWLDNVYITGQVDNISHYFSMADVAVNPMRFGSGTNLKVLEYLAHGLPVLSTYFGIRGLTVENGRHVVVSSLNDFHSSIDLLLNNKELCDRLSENGRKLVEAQYDWKIISTKVADIYRGFF